MPRVPSAQPTQTRIHPTTRQANPTAKIATAAMVNSALMATALSSARFAPDQPCEPCEHDDGRRAPPDRNRKPVDRDRPSGQQPKQMNDGNKGKDSDCCGCE